MFVLNEINWINLNQHEKAPIMCKYSDIYNMNLNNWTDILIKIKEKLYNVYFAIQCILSLNSHSKCAK